MEVSNLHPMHVSGRNLTSPKAPYEVRPSEGRKRVGCYEVKEVCVYISIGDYMQAVPMGGGQVRVEYGPAYDASCKLTREMREARLQIWNAVKDGRIDILKEIYSAQKLVGYFELNEYFTSYCGSKYWGKGAISRFLIGLFGGRVSTLLYEATVRNHSGVVEWLLNQGVPDHQAYDGGWKTAADVASPHIKNLIENKQKMNMEAYEEAVKTIKQPWYYMDYQSLFFLSLIDQK